MNKPQKNRTDQRQVEAIVEDAYREGREDALRDVDTINHADGVLEKNWKESETRQVLHGLQQKEASDE